MAGKSRKGKTSKRRTVRGIKRHRQRKALGFEPLEERRVMSANTVVQYGGDLSNWQIDSFSTATAEGRQAILNREFQRYAEQHAVAPNYISLSIPDDPLFAEQWHLLNMGQQVGQPDFQPIFAVAGEDINVAPVWNDGIFGTGVNVAVVDSGVQLLHPDLLANIHPTLGLDALTLDGDPNPTIVEFDPDGNNILFDPGEGHGTSVAGIIAATANNDLGGTGIAPGASIVPIRLISQSGAQPNLFNAFVDTFRYETDQIDITNNSWGPGVVRGLSGPTQAEFLALRDSAFFGRDGLGVIHVFSSGNSGEERDSSNYNGWVNSRYTIGVTGVDHDGFYNNIDGTVTGYPEIGSSVLVAAPTGSNPQGIIDDNGQNFPFGQGRIGSGITTTDLTGEAGFNVSPDDVTNQEYDGDYLPEIDFTSRFNGTSAAAPIVSGVIALMLEVNPNLSWRDVQEILVRSARQNEPLGKAQNGAEAAFGIAHPNTWVTNQIPLFHDPDPFDRTVDPGLLVYFPTLDPNLTYAPSPSDGFIGAPGDFYLQNHYAPTPALPTNAAGYTVSQGFGSNEEWLGYAHGVVDAEVAVALASQWHEKGQALPEELTFTTSLQTFFGGFIPAAGHTGDDLGDWVVPGGLGGESGFIDYYAEYFDLNNPDDRFLPDELDDLLGQERSDGPIEFFIPDDNAMTVETIEVSLTFDNPVEVLDHLRVVLVSPGGTHSELNFFVPDIEFEGDGIQYLLTPNQPGDIPVHEFAFDTLGSVDTGVNTFTFSTNRNWGERSDSAIIFNSVTGEPVIDTLVGGDGVFNPTLNSTVDITNPGGGITSPPVFGDVLQQGWQLHFENYGNTDVNVTGIEVAWHGSPINPDTERVQGFVGVDVNRDDFFNFSRLLQSNNLTLVDGDPGTIRLGEVVNLIDPNLEDFAENVTVLAHRDVNANGILDSVDVLVDQFVTGHDGNYYFDLTPDNYILSLDASSLGSFTALDDSMTGPNFLPDYLAQWTITEDYFQVWDLEPATFEVPLDPVTGAPIPFIDANGATVPYGVKNINFLLDPGPAVADEVEFSGIVFADVDGDGDFNGDDVLAPNVIVYGDVNRNGEFDSGEVFAETALDGSYTLTVPNGSPAVLNVGVLPPVDWTPTDPGTGVQGFFVDAGDAISGVDFAIMPPVSSSPGDGGSQPGYVLGVVYEDINGDSVRQSFEPGVSGVQVYLDANNSGSFDPTELTTTTNAGGAYIFADVPAGTRRFRITLPGSFEQTFPVFNSPNIVTVAGAGTVNGVRFGVKNNAILDYGDLPDSFGTSSASAALLRPDGSPLYPGGPARHVKGVYYLGPAPGQIGMPVDAEVDGQPTADATGDDAVGADENGILVDALANGGVGRLVATANLSSGFLQGWIDFNGDGNFIDDFGGIDVVAGVSEQIIVNELLESGDNEVFFTIPALADITAGPIYARFRYGEHGLGPAGFARIGEVEDYVLERIAPIVVAVASNGADFTSDNKVSGFDFLAWQRGLGMTSGAAGSDGDANGDAAVDDSDLILWEADYAHGTTPVPLTSAPADFDSSGNTNGNDFLAWQRGVGAADPGFSGGDANGDDHADGEDLAAWEATYAPVEAHAIHSATTGDYNQDGRTGGGDFLAWQRGAGTGSPNLADGDGNGDDAVDGQDLDAWAATFGIDASSGDGSPQNVVAASFARSAFAPQSLSTVAVPESFAELAPTRIELQRRAADVVFNEADVDALRSGTAALALLRRDGAIDEDLFTVSRELAFAEQEGDEQDRDEFFASLPKAFYEK